jgi:hypothetical protein
MLHLAEIDYHSDAWAAIPVAHRLEIRHLVHLFKDAPDSNIVAWLQSLSVQLGCPFPSLRRKYYNWRNSGGQWETLIDRRRAVDHRITAAGIALSQSPRFAAYLVKLVGQFQRKNAPAFRELHRRWRVREHIIPGYEEWQGWPKTPHGWSSRNLARIVKREARTAALRSIRVGTSSKTNPFLPTVLTTRTKLWPGAVIQMDDQWHDNYLTVGIGTKARAVRALELGAQDVFSAHRFHWGCKPRLRRDNGTMQELGGADARLFVAGMFHRCGYSPQGTMLMVEHATMSLSEDIERVLYDATRGMVRVERQPIEGKQAALCGYWNGTEGGNFRAKALLESTHNLIRNDMAALPMQTGSFSSGIAGPVTTDRQLAYINRVLKSVIEKAPHRAHLLKLPTWDFHSQFIPFLTDYYLFGLASRTDHDLEGWNQLGFITTEYTLAPGSGQYLTEGDFLALADAHREIIRAEADKHPDRWLRRRKLSPLEVWDRRPKFSPVSSAIICELIGRDLAREATARRGFIEFSDCEISGDPLVFTARYCSGPHRGMEIPHGEKVSLFANPFDDSTAMVVDAAGRFLGEIPLYQRVTPIDPTAFGSAAPFDARPDIRSAALTRAAGEKHARIADILEPSRILHADAVQEARDLREHNRRVIAGEPVTTEELAAARAASAAKAVTTRRLETWDAAPEDVLTHTPEPPSNIDDDTIADWLND